MRPRWRIELLGPGCARQGNHSVEKFRTQKTLALLGYLALRGMCESRDELAARFWPEAAPERRRQCLRTELAALRGALEVSDADSLPSLFLTDRWTLTLNSTAYTTDVIEFETLVLAAKQTQGAERIRLLTQAVGLVRGQLLAGCCDASFDAWLTQERRRLDDACREAKQMLQTERGAASSRAATIRQTADAKYSPPETPRPRLRELPQEAQAFYTRLSIFPCHFTAAQAVAICGTGEPGQEFETLLAARLLMQPTMAGERRYCLPLLARDGLRARLSAAERQRLARRHAECYLAVAIEGCRGLTDWRNWSGRTGRPRCNGLCWKTTI